LVTVKVKRPGLEGRDHALNSLIEDQADEALQHLVAKFKIDKKVDFGAVCLIVKNPVIV
jgi:hypothetical protein